MDGISLGRASNLLSQADRNLAEMTRYAKECETQLEALGADYEEANEAIDHLEEKYDALVINDRNTLQALEMANDRVKELEAANQALTEEVWRQGLSIEALTYQNGSKDVELASVLRERNSYQNGYKQLMQEFRSLLTEHEALQAQQCDKALIFGSLSDDRCGRVSLEGYTANEGVYDCE